METAFVCITPIKKRGYAVLREWITLSAGPSSAREYAREKNET
jgi:hypothetical protein